MPLVWVFGVVGIVDLINASIRGITVGAVDYQLGGVWFIPTFFVPALWQSQQHARARGRSAGWGIIRG